MVELEITFERPICKAFLYSGGELLMSFNHHEQIVTRLLKKLHSLIDGLHVQELSGKYI